MREEEGTLNIQHRTSNIQRGMVVGMFLASLALAVVGQQGPTIVKIVGPIDVNYSGTSTWANGAATCNWAKVSATASNASVAGFATNASVAGFATNASVAGFATNASVAGLATNASVAGFATNASVAGFATNANYATAAGTASTAGYAGYSDYATFLYGVSESLYDTYLLPDGEWWSEPAPGTTNWLMYAYGRILYGNWTNSGNFLVQSNLTVLGGGNVMTNGNPSFTWTSNSVGVVSGLVVKAQADATMASNSIAGVSNVAWWASNSVPVVSNLVVKAQNDATFGSNSVMGLSNAVFNCTNLVGGGWYSMDASITSLLWYSSIFTCKVGKVTAIAKVAGACTGKVWKTQTPTSLVNAVLVTNAISTVTGIVEACSVGMGYGNALWLDSGVGGASATNYQVLIEVTSP